jgi:hypothetical protein
MNAARVISRDLPKVVAGLGIVAFALLPTAGLPAFYALPAISAWAMPPSSASACTRRRR